MVALALLGAGTPRRRRSDPPPPKVDETIGDLAIIASHSDQRLEGVGLVRGLDNTGADPPPSWYREKLVDEMRKAGVENANKLLADPRVSMVIVRVNIPTGTSTTDHLDAQIELPPGSGTKSLAGGYLMSCRLKEVMIAGGTPKEGPELAVAEGPVLIGTEARPDDTKHGRVLGGARIRKEIPFTLAIKENRRSFKTAKMIEDVINRRFHQTEGLKQVGMATAKTDEYLVLRVPNIYHHNFLRYFRVVKLLASLDNPALQEQRKAVWGKELLDPSKAGIAALRLEGIGITAIDTLKTGLTSSSDQVKFFAAEALAYLNDASGAEILGENAIKRPQFRAYALAALAAADQPAARIQLIKLMNVPEVAVRYGAFHALRTMDEYEPVLGRVQVMDEIPVDPDDTDSMSLAIRGPRRQRVSREDPFELYIVDSDGPPLVHLSRTRRCEIVLFGKDQRLLTPIVLGTGSILLNAADGDETVQISRISSGRAGEEDAKVEASLVLGDVVRRTANLGAKYPEVASILYSAYNQKNLPGGLVIDAVPGPTPAYVEAALMGKDVTKKDDALKKTSLEKKKPGFFGRLFRRK
jgi:hypothetical protein